MANIVKVSSTILTSWYCTVNSTDRRISFLQILTATRNNLLLKDFFLHKKIYPNFSNLPILLWDRPGSADSLAFLCSRHYRWRFLALLWASLLMWHNATRILFTILHQRQSRTVRPEPEPVDRTVSGGAYLMLKLTRRRACLLEKKRNPSTHLSGLEKVPSQKRRTNANPANPFVLHHVEWFRIIFNFFVDITLPIALLQVMSHYWCILYYLLLASVLMSLLVVCNSLCSLPSISRTALSFNNCFWIVVTVMFFCVLNCGKSWCGTCSYFFHMTTIRFYILLFWKNCLEIYILNICYCRDRFCDWRLLKVRLRSVLLSNV